MLSFGIVGIFSSQIAGLPSTSACQRHGGSAAELELAGAGLSRLRLSAARFGSAEHLYRGWVLLLPAGINSLAMVTEDLLVLV
jgi:hypothetical protein